MRILITGGSGFIGKHLIYLLSKTKNKVVVLNRSENKQKYSNIKSYKINLSNVSSYKKILRKFKPEVVIHLAWEKIPNYDYHTSKLNLDNSINFFINIFSLKSCKKIIVAGTCWEYNILRGSCNPKEKGTPYNYFTWAKHSLKNWLDIESKNYDVNLIWLRVFYAYGPHQRSGSLLPTIFNSLTKGKYPNIQNIYNKNDFIFVHDVAKIFYNSIYNKIKTGVYNCSSGKSTSVFTIISIAEKIINNDNKLTKKLKKENLNKSEMNFWGTNNLTKKYFYPFKIHTIEEGIKISYKYFLKSNKNAN